MKIPHVALLPKTPFRIVMLGLWSTRTAARFAPEERRPSITMNEENVTKIVSRLSLRSVVMVTCAPVPCALIVMGATAVPWMSFTSKPR